ncbi:hypothetical protein, partial [Faecalibaculum rodentium]|uniref:hypothetical protein n=1 Tax=Faecalibaculum rodentium TaxID=1702221 RepID=UPI0025B793F2
KLRDGDDSRKAKITNGHSGSRFPYGRRLFCLFSPDLEQFVVPDCKNFIVLSAKQVSVKSSLSIRKKETWDTISFTEDTVLQVSISSF